MCRQVDIAGAVQKIDVVRRARNCQTGSYGEMSKRIKDLDTFKKEIIKEALRDFMQEGQAFFYYKRLGVSPKDGVQAANLVFPKPDNETIH